MSIRLTGNAQKFVQVVGGGLGVGNQAGGLAHGVSNGGAVVANAVPAIPVGLADEAEVMHGEHCSLHRPHGANVGGKVNNVGVHPPRSFMDADLVVAQPCERALAVDEMQQVVGDAFGRGEVAGPGDVYFDVIGEPGQAGGEFGGVASGAASVGGLEGVEKHADHGANAWYTCMVCRAHVSHEKRLTCSRPSGAHAVPLRGVSKHVGHGLGQGIDIFGVVDEDGGGADDFGHGGVARRDDGTAARSWLRAGADRSLRRELERANRSAAL